MFWETSVYGVKEKRKKSLKGGKKGKRTNEKSFERGGIANHNLNIYMSLKI